MKITDEISRNAPGVQDTETRHHYDSNTTLQKAAMAQIKGDHVKLLRLRKQWTQKELARAADVELRTIQRMERNCTASLDSLEAVASALGVSAEELIDDSFYVPDSIPRSDIPNSVRLKLSADIPWDAYQEESLLGPLVRELLRLASLGHTVIVEREQKGSVRITLLLEAREARRILNTFVSNRLDELDVREVQLPDLMLSELPGTEILDANNIQIAHSSDGTFIVRRTTRSRRRAEWLTDAIARAAKNAEAASRFGLSLRVVPSHAFQRIPVEEENRSIFELHTPLSAAFEDTPEWLVDCCVHPWMEVSSSDKIALHIVALDELPIDVRAQVKAGDAVIADMKAELRWENRYASKFVLPINDGAFLTRILIWIVGGPGIRIEFLEIERGEK